MEIYHPRDEELLREMKRVRRSDRRRRLCRGLIILLTLSIAVGLFVFLRYYQLAVAHGTGIGIQLAWECGKELKPFLRIIGVWTTPPRGKNRQNNYFESC